MAAYLPSGPGRYRLNERGPASEAVASSSLVGLSTPSESGANEGRPWHPSSPLFAFAGIAALTIGLMAVSTTGSASLRLGKTTATVAGGVGVGKTGK